MNWVIYFFASGLAFFAGAAALLLGVALAALWRPRLGVLLALLGLALVAVSATPLPYWLYATAGAVTAGWVGVERFGRRVRPRWRAGARAAVALVWLSAVAVELPYHVTPAVPALGRPALYVVGDSVTAGMGGDRIVTWPRILARDRAITIHDYSRMGATVASARRQLDTLPLGDGLVLLEIGGNDLLGSTSAAAFEDGLGRLLEHVCGPGRTVLMFELPLPPFANGYGLAQRRLAARHGVLLVPKRIFMGVLAGGGATLDSIHLSPEGQAVMAETVWGLIAGAYGE